MKPVGCARVSALASRSGLPSCALRIRCPLLLLRPSRWQPATAAAAASADGVAGCSNGVGPAAGIAFSPGPSQLDPSGVPSSAQQNGLHAAPPATYPPAQDEPQTLLGRVRRFFTGSKLDKARLAALGFGAFSAYGVISNINAGVLITIAWLAVVRTTGLTPLDGGNWPRFLAIYAGLWVGSNFLRPVRLTLALAVAPLFDSAIGAVSRRIGLPKIPAFVVMLLFIAVGTTSTLLATLAVLGGFPPGCRMPWQP